MLYEFAGEESQHELSVGENELITVVCQVSDNLGVGRPDDCSLYRSILFVLQCISNRFVLLNLTTTSSYLSY